MAAPTRGGQPGGWPECNLLAMHGMASQAIMLPAQPSRRADVVGLLNFVDSSGTRWRVWHVETPMARAHLMDASFRNGWLVFEKEDASERRRLAQVPEDWAHLTPD